MSPSTSYGVLRMKLGSESSIVRHLYIKPYAGTDAVPQDRSLFVAGLPAGLNDGALLQLLAKHGEVERVAVHGSRVSAVVIYADKKGRDALLKYATKGKVIIVNNTQEEGKYFGLKSWVEAHKAQKPGNVELQRQLDEWMEDYEAEEQKKKEEAMQAMEGDGWTVVQRHKGRKKSSTATGTAVGAVAAAAAATRVTGKRKLELTNFYRFQQRERRRSDLVELRQKFEEDKKRLAELKALRKFNPN